MKLFLISGNAHIAVQNKVSQIKKAFDPLSITEISEKDTFDLFSQPLFSNKRLVILDSPNLKMVEQVLIGSDPDLTILIKFLKTLEKSSPILKAILEAKGEVVNFDESKEVSIFPFLDLLGTRNRKTYFELEKNYSEFGGQYILTMLYYFLRRMIQKPKTNSDFMRQKIESQKRNFDLEKIKKLYREILETDFKIKSGLIEEKMGVTMIIQKII